MLIWRSFFSFFPRRAGGLLIYLSGGHCRLSYLSPFQGCMETPDGHG